MLPLITNVLPGPQPGMQSAPTAQLLASAMQSGVAASRHQLPVAVLATGAPAAYSPLVREWKQAGASRPATAVSEEAPRPHEDSPITIKLPETPRLPSRPFALGIPLSTQFSAQLFAQAAPLQWNTPQARYVIGRKAGLADAKGAAAYQIAQSRTARVVMSLPKDAS